MRPSKVAATPEIAQKKFVHPRSTAQQRSPTDGGFTVRISGRVHVGATRTYSQRMSFDSFAKSEPDLSPNDAAVSLLTYGISIAERGPDQVTVPAYRSAHRSMLADPGARRAASGALRRCNTPELLWSHLRSVATGSGSWAVRRAAVHDLLDPVLEVLDRAEQPADDLVTSAADRLNSDSVRDAWTRALERRDSEPEGAVTMARTLLESTIKTILDDRGVSYRRQDDLPALYRAVGRELGLAPDGYSEEAFRQILGGCSSVVTGLGSLRNQVSDAHGLGRTRYRPAARHATLAVNLAGSMALFLIQTHEAVSDQ